MSKPCKIVVLISGSGTNLQALIDSCQRNEVNGEIVAVISNKEAAYGLVRAQKHSIPAIAIDHRQYSSREDFDLRLAKEIDGFSPGLVVLAGFMRILSPVFVERFAGRMLNIHPSLLPKYPGLNTHQRALENNDSLHGASIHFVTQELDGGPVILQSEIAIKNNDTPSSLAERISLSEWIIYPLAVKWFCEGALKMSQERVLFRSELLNDFTFKESVSCQTEGGEPFDCKINVKIDKGNIQNDEKAC